MEPSYLQVVLMGLITVFVVLICLIVIIKIMGAVMTSITGKSLPASQAAVSAPAPVPAPAAPQAVSGSKQQLVAAIAVALAEDMGTDASHLKIHSIRKL